MELLFLEACIQVDSEKQQVLTTNRKENRNVTVYPYVCLEQLFCFKTWMIGYQEVVNLQGYLAVAWLGSQEFSCLLLTPVFILE